MFRSEKTKIRVIFTGVILITILAFLVDFGAFYNNTLGKTLPKIKEVPYRLGLDLLGGTHLVYKADVSQVSADERSSAVEGVRDVIERRINVFGVSEPVVQSAKSGDEYRIVVELAGIKDINQAINMIGETPLLEFKEEDTDVKDLTDEQKKQVEEYNKDAEKRAQDIFGKALSGGDFFSLAQEFSEDENVKESNGGLGWINKGSGYDEIFQSSESGDIAKEPIRLVDAENGFNIIKINEKRTQKEGDLGLDKKEVKASHILICFQGAQNCQSDLTREQARQQIDELKKQATPANFSQLAAQVSGEPGAETNKGNLGWFTREAMVSQFSDAVFSQKVGTISDVVETEFGFHLIYKEDERFLYEYNVDRILIYKLTKDAILGAQDPWKNTQLTGKNLKRATVQFNQNDNTPEIRLEFDSEGSTLFSEITKRNVGKPVAIFLDGQPISIPTVNQEITSGDAVISGHFTIKEAKILAQRLNAGALPIPIELINQQTVGASLGAVSVEKSLKAGIIGVILVALFIILFYRLPGILAVISLTVYGLLMLAIFKLWPVTLTLSGLAGFVLSIGMAVDANILIFARFKEELRDHKPMSKAISESFRRAWPSIRDGNASTLLTCLVLINFTTSIVKGFAITLGVGVLVSMFSAIFVTKVLMQLTLSDKLSEKRWLFGVKKDK